MVSVGEKVSISAAVISGIAALISAAFSGYSSVTAQQALESSERISREAERVSLFSQFQDQYGAISSRFPRRFLEPAFRPLRGSDDYARLEAYWFFCFSEWYATNRVNPQFQGLWRDYYSPLIADGLEIPSLRYVLEERVRTRGAGRGEWRTFLKELSSTARTYGRPLDSDVIARIDS